MNRIMLRVALDWEVDEIDPPCSFGGWNTGRVVQQMFDSLVDDDLEAELSSVTSLIPSLACDYFISSDGLKYTFNLRDGVFFHDGVAFDASAVCLNVERMWDRSSPIFDDRAHDYNRIAVELIESVRAIDTHRVELQLSQPFPELLRYMTQEDAPGSFSMVSPNFLRAPNKKRGSAPGTGPFALERRFETQYGSGVLLRRFPQYWGVCPSLEFMEFKPYPSANDRAAALLNGEADVAYGPPSDAIDELIERGFIVSDRPVPYVWYFALNVRQAPLNDVRVRRAILLGINRLRLSEELFGSAASAVNGLVPPACPSFEPNFPDLYPYNPRQARQLLKEAGVQRFSLVLVVARAGSGQLDPMGISEFVRRDLAEIGVDVSVRMADDWVRYCEDWHQGMTADVGASEMSWGMSCDIWLDQVLHSRNASPLGFNTGYYANADVDRILDTARAELDPLRRAELYRVAHRLIMLDAPVIPLLTVSRGLIAHSPRVRGLRFAAQNWHNLSRVWVDRG